MNKEGPKKFFFGIIFALLFITLALAIPQITTNSPSVSPLLTNNQSIELNFSIDESSIGSLIYNWNGTNYTFYNDSLVLIMNFNNLVALGENSSFVRDLSRYGNNGTLYGNAFLNSSGKYSGGAWFDGSGDYVQIANSASDSITGEMTISAWIKATTWKTNRWEGTIVGKDEWSGAGSLSKGYVLRTGENGVLSFTISTAGSINWREAYSSSLMSVGDWYHVTGTFNGTDTKVFINGVQRGINTAAYSLMGVSSYPVEIGRSPYDTTRAFNGAIDEVRIWNRSLSAQEVYQIYASNLQKFNSTQWYLYVNQSKNSTTGLDYGTYNYQIFASDGIGNLNYTNLRTIILRGDVTGPAISIYSPVGGTTYTSSSVGLNWSANENVSWCGYSLDNAANDSSIMISSAKIVYNSTGSIQSFIVPSGVTSLNVKVWGAGGGGGTWSTSYHGGSGGFANGTISVTPGQNLTIIVGGGGKKAGAGYSGGGLGGYGGGGYGTDGDAPGAGGGGLSGIFNGSFVQSNSIIIAGGGGGGTGYSAAAGGGGGIAGNKGGLTGGCGGNQTSGGACLTYGVDGSALQGGNGDTRGVISGGDYYDGGGGGGGYFGGEGGISDARPGGGGSGYNSSSIVSNSFLVVGNNGTGPLTASPPMTTDSDYVSGVSIGGNYSTNGGNGSIVISYNVASGSTAVNKTLNALSDGIHSVQIYCNDSSGNMGQSSLVSFTVNTGTADLTSPLVSILYPTNTSYNSIVNQLNYSVSDNNLSRCWYSTNLGVANTTITCGQNVTGLSASEGSNTWKIWANDTSGNINSSSITFNKDSTYPQFSGYWDNNATLTSGNGIALFNVSLQNTNGTVWITINGTNYYASNLSLNIYNVSITGLTNRTYLYNWSAYGNGTSKNLNTSGNRYYYVNETIPDIDGDGISDGSDNLLYNEGNVSTSGITNLNVSIGGNSTNGSYSGVHEIAFYDSSTKLFNFTHNFSSSIFNLKNVSIIKGDTYLIVNLSGQLQSDYNKTIYLNDSGFISLCVKDAEISSISEMSSDCAGANETNFNSCIGDSTGITNNSITCLDYGNVISVSNLRFSAIRGTLATTSTSSTSQGSSGGSSGGFIQTRQCSVDADCKSGYSCYKWKCVKLFDAEILEVSPLIGTLSFELKYLIKGMAEINGDVIINFWIQNDKERIDLGKDTIYLGSFEEKIKNTTLNLPREMNNETYDLHIQVEFENYKAESFRKVNIDLPRSIDFSPEEKSGISWWLIFIIILLIAVISFILGERWDRRNGSRIKSKVKEGIGKIKWKFDNKEIKVIRPEKLKEEKIESNEVQSKLNSIPNSAIPITPVANEVKFVPEKYKVVKTPSGNILQKQLDDEWIRESEEMKNLNGKEVYAVGGIRIGRIVHAEYRDKDLYGFLVALDERYGYGRRYLIKRIFVERVGKNLIVSNKILDFIGRY